MWRLTWGLAQLTIDENDKGLTLNEYPINKYKIYQYLRIYLKHPYSLPNYSTILNNNIATN